MSGLKAVKDLIKIAILSIAKYTGLFSLARSYYKNRIRILCYHGFSLRDEEQFVPGLFVKPEIFDKRMKYLKDKGYNIISLDEAYEAVKSDKIEDNSVVITIDDGFYSTFAAALPILKKYNFASTLYLTSFYFDKPFPIFTLTLDYMFWRNEQSVIDFSTIGIEELETFTAVKAKSKEFEKAQEIVKSAGRSYKNEEKRFELLQKLGDTLKQDFDDIAESRILAMLDEDELKECIDAGMDIEIHTHGHSFPTDMEKAKREIQENKKRIDPLLPRPMRHFCYPSGRWSKEHWPLLDQQNIKTSTTCDNGLVTTKTPVHAWSRYLDSARISQLEYEAELAGFNELLRAVRGK